MPFRDIHKLPLPAGKGAGEQYVRQHYPREVKVHRSKKNHMAIRLGVLIDADTHSVVAHHEQLEKALADAEMPGRVRGEGIGVLVPKRNVETWVARLNGSDVDETTDYKPKSPEETCAAAKRLIEVLRNAPGTTEPPSLTSARDELKEFQ